MLCFEVEEYESRYIPYIVDTSRNLYIYIMTMFKINKIISYELDNGNVHILEYLIRDFDKFLKFLLYNRENLLAKCS